MRKRGTVPREHVAGLMVKKREDVRKDWSRHRSLQVFLREYFPNEWDRIRNCRLSYQEMEEAGNPGWFKVVPRNVCEQIPYCIRCTRANTERRVWTTLNQYSRCTPRGKKLRFQHIVQTAPIYKDGTGWGVAASQNIAAFAKLVWETLVEFHGEGIGAYMSYQDFGERGFNKRHPHMDLTLNGWMLQDGQPVQTPTIDLKRGGRGRWDEAIRGRATAFQVDAGRGSIDFGVPKIGVRAYYKILRYQVREMADFRKVTYLESPELIQWTGYKDQPPAAMTVDHFMESLAEYQARTKAWTRQAQLHRSFGHMAKKSLKATEKTMDGDDLPHGADCPCGECGDWHVVFLDDIYDIRRGTPLDGIATEN